MRTGLLVFVALGLLFCIYSENFVTAPAKAQVSLDTVQDPASIPDRSYPAPKGQKALLIGAACRANLVLLVGERGLIFRSTDGGKNFQQVDSPTRRMICSVILADDQLAYAVGHDMTVLRSRDSGHSWQQVYRDPDADLALFSVVSLGGGKVLAVGSFGTVLLSDDDGENWRQQLISEDGPHLYSVKQMGSNLVVVGEFGSIFKSEDAGDSWNLLESPYEGTFFDVIPLVNSQRLLLLGLRGNLWEGQVGDWKRIDTGFEASLFGGSILSNGRVVVVGDEGRVMVRSATGQWHDRSPGERRLLSSATGLTDDSVVIVGEKGYRIRSISGSDSTDGEERR